MSEAAVIFGTSFVVALSGALMPGPLLALTVAETARRGFRAGPLLVLGHGILEMALLVALVKGLSQVIENGLPSALISLVGGIILIGMGATILARVRQRMTIVLTAPPSAGHERALVLSGVLGSVSNPYWFIWWVTIGTTYLTWSLRIGTIGVASFFTGHILADLGWYSVVAFIIATGKKVMSDATYRALIAACGLALLGIGGYFIASGIQFLTA